MMFEAGSINGGMIVGPSGRDAPVDEVASWYRLGAEAGLLSAKKRIGVPLRRGPSGGSLEALASRASTPVGEPRHYDLASPPLADSERRALFPPG